MARTWKVLVADIACAAQQRQQVKADEVARGPVREDVVHDVALGALLPPGAVRLRPDVDKEVQGGQRGLLGQRDPVEEAVDDVGACAVCRNLHGRVRMPNSVHVAACGQHMRRTGSISIAQGTWRLEI